MAFPEAERRAGPQALASLTEEWPGTLEEDPLHAHILNLLVVPQIGSYFPK